MITWMKKAKGLVFRQFQPGVAYKRVAYKKAVYTVYILKLGQFFFHTYSLTCFNKDASVLLKVCICARSF